MRRPDPTPEALAVGSVIRGHRRRLGVSMADLAARSELSQPFLSQLERGLTTPSLASIYKIAEALGLPPGIFLRPSSTADTVAHEEDPQVIRVTEGTGQFAHVLIPGGQSDVMEAYEQHFTPEQGERGWFEHTGEDFIYVLEGEVDLELRDQEPIRLRAGQSAHHRGDIPHRCRLVGTEPARTLLVVALGR